MLSLAAASTAIPRWGRDPELGDGFVQATLQFPADYDGAVTATLVRNDPLVPHARGAVLYLHGFIDYFFQRHLAAAFTAAGCDFYALDLRKYGRSLGTAAHQNFCKDLEEYFPEITSAIDVITTVERHAAVVVLAHSTGALTAALYAQTGDRRDRVSRLIFNSPFLELPQGSTLAHLGALWGRVLPLGRIRNPVNPWYAKSLHAEFNGEWHFNTAWKPIDGFDAFYGWLSAVVRAQDRIKKGLDLEQPVLVLHSDRSEKGSTWSESFHRADLVLDVEDIKRLAPRLGPRTEIREIRGGKHDLVLSREDARTECLRVMIEWVTD